MEQAQINIVGGQSIPNSLALLYLGRSWSKSSYLGETALSTNNNGANVYLWSFSADASETATTGVDLNTYKFTGNEQLQINFVGSLAAGVTIEVFAQIASAVEVSHHGVKKLSIH